MTMDPRELERRIRNGEPIPAAAAAPAGNGSDPHAAPLMVQIVTENGPAVVPVELGTFLVLGYMLDVLTRIEAMFKQAQGEEATDANTEQGATPPASRSGLLEA